MVSCSNSQQRDYTDAMRQRTIESLNLQISSSQATGSAQLPSYLHNQRHHFRLASLLLMSFHWVASKCTFLLQAHVCQNRRGYDTTTDVRLCMKVISYTLMVKAKSSVYAETMSVLPLHTK